MLELLGCNNLLLVVNDGGAADNALFLLWISVHDHLEAGVGLLVHADEFKIKGKGVVIVKHEKFINKLYVRWQRIIEGLVAEKISNNIIGSGEVDNFWTIFFNNQSPVVDTISGEVGEGKILVVNVDVDDVH